MEKQPQPETAAKLVGVPGKLVSDADVAARDGGCCAAKLDVTVADGVVSKRKRGRPARGVPKTTPPPKQQNDEEDVCFICFDGGSLVLCDRRGCPKAYHPACVKRDEAFFRSKAKWNCGWHICSSCEKASHYMCYTCTYSLCKGCIQDADFVCIRGNKGLCGICMKTIMLIENSSQGNKEKCEVDFDDKTSWEYLFKVYWMYLKEKLSLTFDELLRAKNPLKGAAPMSCKVQTSHELNHLKENTSGAGIIDAVANEGEAIDNSKQSMLVNDKRCTTSKKADVLEPQNNPNAYAAINTHNINLIYMRRNLMESLTDDAERIREKVVGSFVRIRISSGDQKQDMYRLVQVVGTSKVAEPYKIGTRTTDIKLEILNLNRKELISIDEISNQEFSEDECKRLRQSIKYGLSKRLTVGEILGKALTLQEIRVNDLLEAEILRHNHLRDRASEKGLRKELKECVEKLQLLNSPEERQRRLHEIPDVHSDPNLDSLFESDEDAGESDDSKKDGNKRSKCPGLDRRERIPLFSRIWDGVLNDFGCRTQDLTTASDPIGNICAAKNDINHKDTAIDDSINDLTTVSGRVGNICETKNDSNLNDTAIDDSSNVVIKSEASSVAVGISSSLPSEGIEQPVNDYMNDKLWHYQDPSGKVQGPFSMLQLYKWNASGHFPPDLRIWRIDDKRDNCILLTDALNGKYTKNVSLPDNGQLLSLGSSVTLGDKEISQDGVGNATRSETSADSRVIEPSREQKMDDISTQSNGKDESIRSNGWHDQSHVYPSLPPTTFSMNLNESHTTKLSDGFGIEGNSEDNGNHGSNRTSDGQSNSGQSYQKQLDSEDNSGKSSGQNWRHPNVNSSSDSLVTTSVHVSGTRTSPHKLGFDLHRPPSPPTCSTTTWQAIIGEPDDFDESVSDLLAEVEAMESLGGLESPTSIMKRNEELTDSSKNDCLTLSFAELSPMLAAGKGDALRLSSTIDLHLPCQSTAAEEPLQQADVHHDHHHQRISREHALRNSEVDVGTKNISVSSHQWDSGSENSPIFASTLTLGMGIDTTWRLGSENTHLGWGGMDQRNANTGWGVGQTAVHENRSSNSYTSVVAPGSGDSQTKYGSDRFPVPRDRGFPGNVRESGFGRGRTAGNRQPLFGVGNGGSYRPLPKGQRVCKFYESGYCKKGASCHYLHP